MSTVATGSSSSSRARTVIASTALVSRVIDSSLSYHSRTSTGTETMTEAVMSKAIASRVTVIRIEVAGTSCKVTFAS